MAIDLNRCTTMFVWQCLPMFVWQASVTPKVTILCCPPSFHVTQTFGFIWVQWQKAYFVSEWNISARVFFWFEFDFVLEALGFGVAKLWIHCVVATNKMKRSHRLTFNKWTGCCLCEWYNLLLIFRRQYQHTLICLCLRVGVLERGHSKSGDGVLGNLCNISGQN